MDTPLKNLQLLGAPSWLNKSKNIFLVAIFWVLGITEVSNLVFGTLVRVC